MQFVNNVSKANLDQFRQRKGLTKFRVEYIEQPFINNVKCLSTYKYQQNLENSYVYSFNIDGNLLQIHLIMDKNQIIALPVVKLKNEDYFSADFHVEGSHNNKMVCWFVNRIYTEFFDSESESILGTFSNSQTLGETTERFRRNIRNKQLLGDLEDSFYYADIGNSVIMTIHK